MQFKQCGAAKPHLHNTDARCYLSIDSLTHHTFDLAQVSRYPLSHGGGLGLGDCAASGDFQYFYLEDQISIWWDAH